MLELKTKQKLAIEAHNFARGSELVRFRSTTYIPVDYETGDSSVVPDPGRTIWLPLTRAEIQRHAAEQFNTLFANDSEARSFEFMVAQNCVHVDTPIRDLLVRTDAGLQRLSSTGKLLPPNGTFVPNTLKPVLNTEKVAKEKIFRIIVEWLDSEEEARALLSHLATSLAPGWSAVKYVLLLGEGRNGKSTLMKMLHRVFGFENVSSVTRQDMADKSPVVTELNGKLLNLVYDGQAEFLKDSGIEKTLIAGEPASIRLLYESTPTVVQTSALFVEGLQKEPKTSDKSSALQKRIVRFLFPKVYALDHAFERDMLTEESLGAFLALLIDHYVVEDAVAIQLAPTTKAVELQLEHMYVNSVALQFIKHLEDTATTGATEILGEPLTKVCQMFQAWRIQQNDLSTWAEPDVMALFLPLVNTERKSMRTSEGPRKVRLLTSFKDETAQFIETLKGEESHDEAAVVED